MKPEPRWIMPLLLACVACGAAAGEEPDYKIALSNWSYSRERKTVNSSNRVIANFTLKNRTTASISGVHVTLTYASGLGEKIGEALKDNVGTIRNGESKKISITADFLPAFGSFTGAKVVRPREGDRGGEDAGDRDHARARMLYFPRLMSHAILLRRSGLPPAR